MIKFVFVLQLSMLLGDGSFITFQTGAWEKKYHCLDAMKRIIKADIISDKEALRCVKVSSNKPTK